MVCLSPPDDSRTGRTYMFCLRCFFLTPMHALVSQTTERRPVKSIPAEIRSQGNSQNSLIHFAHPSPTCYRRGSKRPKFCVDFRQQSPLTDCGFKTEELIGNLYFHSDSNISPSSPPIFMEG